MAAPVIDSVTVEPDPVPPGQTAQIKINAHDPDEETLDFHATVTDHAGTSTEWMGSAHRSDPLTYELTVSEGTVHQDSTDPSLWTWEPPGAPHDHDH